MRKILLATVALSVVLMSTLCDSSRWHHEFDNNDIFDSRRYQYKYRNRSPRSHFLQKEPEPGQSDSEPLRNDMQYPSDEGSETTGRGVVPPFDRYNLNEIEIALAQTLYLMIVPEIKKAVEFKMDEIVEQYRQSAVGAPPPGFRPPNPNRLPGNKQEAGPQPQHRSGGGSQSQPEFPSHGGAKSKEPIIPVWDYAGSAKSIQQPNLQHQRQQQQLPQHQSLQQPQQQQQEHPWQQQQPSPQGHQQAPHQQRQQQGPQTATQQQQRHLHGPQMVPGASLQHKQLGMSQQQAPNNPNQPRYQAM